MLMFAVLILAATPLYLGSLWPADCAQGCAGTTGWRGPLWMSALGGGVIGVYWLCALVVGSLTTALWYPWHARVTGVATRATGSVTSWLTGTLILVVASALALGGLVAVVLTYRRTFPLLVIAAGMVVLAWVERSRLLAAVALTFTLTALLAVLYNTENLLFTALHHLGVSDRDMPVGIGPAFDVFLPGLVLLLGAAVAWTQDFRRR